MFSVVENGDNRLDVEVGGKLDSEVTNAVLDELMAKSGSIERGRVIYLE